MSTNRDVSQLFRSDVLIMLGYAISQVVCFTDIVFTTSSTFNSVDYMFYCARHI